MKKEELLNNKEFLEWAKKDHYEHFKYELFGYRLENFDEDLEKHFESYKTRYEDIVLTIEAIRFFNR